MEHSEAHAVRKTGLCALPGVVLHKPGLLLTSIIKDGARTPKTMPFKPAWAQSISNPKNTGDVFLSIRMKGDLRELDQQMPYIYMHRLQVSRLIRFSRFGHGDIQQTITRKLLMFYRQADSLNC